MTERSLDATPAGPPRLNWRQRLDAYERLLRLDKPIGTLLLLWPTLAALWLATFGRPPLSLIVVFVMGTWLMRSAGCALNDWADRDFDGYVKRTANRPLAARIIAPWEALVLAAVLALAAFGLVLTTTRAAILWSIPALAIAIAYPFFKRFFVLPQAFLGIAFSFGIPMAYAAVWNRVPALAWWLLGLNLLWVIAYDTEYAMVDRDYDVSIGIRTSALTFGRYDVLAVALCYALYLAGLAWIGRYLRLGPLYFGGLAVAAGMAGWHVWLIRDRAREPCFRAFLHNHWLGFTVFAGIVLDYVLRLHAWPTRW
jgi:4-hydroxybenzoate polyprenyltransferase